MRKLLLSLAFVATAILAFAQAPTDCAPNPIYNGFPVGVYPLPDTTNFADSTLGIQTLAHQGCPWEFTFTAIVPDSLELNGIELDLDSVVIATDGAITGTPAGIDDYLCNPPSCVFPDESEGCLTIYGTPTEAPGKDSLEIVATVYFNSDLLPFAVITFPDEAIAPGVYTIWTVDDVCPPPSSTRNEDSDFTYAQNNPNPFNGITNVTYNTKTSMDVDFTVYNVLGKQVYTERQGAIAGENTFQFDGSNLNPGVYLYTIGKGNDVITKRMVINK